MEKSPWPPSFEDFPEDVQIRVLSFLTRSEIVSIACTCRKFSALSREERLWISLCHLKWGSKTLIQDWTTRNGKKILNFSKLFEILSRCERLIGFWRGIDREKSSLAFFEWGKSFISGFRVLPTVESGSYDVIRVPFFWLGISDDGDEICYVCRSSGLDLADSVEKLGVGCDFFEPDLVRVRVCFVGERYFVVDGGKEDLLVCDVFGDGSEEVMYRHFANRVSPGKERSSRKQRKKRGKRGWEAEHFVKISDCCPIPGRPLQGLWKGICENMSLEFYLITYDEDGGVACRKVGNASEPISGYSAVLWTSKRTFLEHPFSKEEENLFTSRKQIQPSSFSGVVAERSVSRVLPINRICDDGRRSSANMKNEEGRVWEYDSGRFGFGFLRSGHIVDLQLIVVDGCILDCVNVPCKGLCSW